MTADELSKHERRIYYGSYQSNKMIKSKIDSIMDLEMLDSSKKID